MLKIKNKLPGDLSNKDILTQIIRVNQAGEYGAKRIYEGQIAIFNKQRHKKKYAKALEVVKEMKQQEVTHLNYFNKELKKRSINPTIFEPVWHVAGWFLGAVTAKISTEAAMACTVAVEEVIDEHYQQQIETMIYNDEMQESEKELINKIKQFRDEEIEHKNLGLENNAENAIGYDIMVNVIKKCSKIAIWLSKQR